MVSAAGDFVYAKFSEINVIIRPSCFFLPSFFTVFVKDQIASLKLKQIIAFLN